MVNDGNWYLLRMVTIDRSMQTTMPGNALSRWWAWDHRVIIQQVHPSKMSDMSVSFIRSSSPSSSSSSSSSWWSLSLSRVMMDPEPHLNLCILIWGANWIIQVDALRKVNIAIHLLQLRNPWHLSRYCSWRRAASREQCYGLKLISWLKKCRWSKHLQTEKHKHNETV